MLNEEIRNIRIPDTGNDDVKASNVRITGFKPPAYSYALSPPSSFSWGITGAGISLSGDIQGCVRIFKKICKTVSVDIDASAVSFRVMAKFGHIASTGQPTIVSADCQASIGNLNLKVSGGALGWLVNLFHDKIADILKGKVQEMLCPKVKEFILKNVNAKLATFPVQTRLGHFFNLDYGLVSDPAMTSDYIDVPIKGKISSQTFPAVASPYVPAPMTQVVPNDRMFYTWVSDTVVNDILYLAHVTNITNRFLTDKIPAVGPYLKLTCDPGKMCLGSILPDLKAKLPPTVTAADAHLMTTSPPSIKINGNNSASLAINVTVDLFVKIPASGKVPETKQTIALLEVGLTTDLEIKVQDMRITGRVHLSPLQLHVLKSDLGFLPPALETALPALVTPIMEHLINTHFAAGVPIPVTKGIKLINPQIRLLERVVQLESDVAYTP